MCGCNHSANRRLKNKKIGLHRGDLAVSSPSYDRVFRVACTGVGYMDDDLERSTLLRKGKERSLQKSLHEKMESVRFDYRERMIVAAKKYLC